MNILEHGRTFLASLQELAGRSAWVWKRCPHCGSTWTIKWGSYTRRPWHLSGRETVRVQRHQCHNCKAYYSEPSPRLVRGSWYAREVHRAAIDHWQHAGTSLRRTAELLRSWMGHQERWWLWHPLEEVSAKTCYLGASTVHRWLDGAGRVATERVEGQLEGIGQSRVLSVDGLWAKLKGQVKRVVLLVVDSTTGLVYPPVVTSGEESASSWEKLFARARQAGLDLDAVCGVTSDGAQGLLAYVSRALDWAYHQRCVWHLWRNLAGVLCSAASAAAHALSDEAAEQVRRQVRAELTGLIHRVIDAQSYAQAEAALALLLEHAQGATIGQMLNVQLDRILAHLLDVCHGLPRVTAEWYWRDFRQRLSHGRNHRSDQRIERAALVWAIYHNFEPAQWRSERKRHYRYPGQSALQVAGVPPGQVSYLDALGV
jgi:transposase-like protein